MNRTQLGTRHHFVSHPVRFMLQGVVRRADLQAAATTWTSTSARTPCSSARKHRSRAAEAVRGVRNFGGRMLQRPPLVPEVGRLFERHCHHRCSAPPTSSPPPSTLFVENLNPQQIMAQRGNRLSAPSRSHVADINVIRQSEYKHLLTDERLLGAVHRLELNAVTSRVSTNDMDIRVYRIRNCVRSRGCRRAPGSFDEPYPIPNPRTSPCPE
jgi:hypothetical protein